MGACIMHGTIPAILLSTVYTVLCEARKKGRSRVMYIERSSKPVRLAPNARKLRTAP
jgi:hypothetical protein